MGDEKQAKGAEYWPVVNFRMPEEQVRQLEDYSRSHTLGKSAVIRTALMDAGVITTREAVR